MNEDVRSVSEAGDFGKALENLSQRLHVSPTIMADEFLKRYDRSGNRFLRLMLYLVLFRKEAKDWVDGTRLGYDKTGGPMTTGFEPQWHHIYPRRVLRNEKTEDDNIHALANITVLNERTNVNKLSGKEPWRYIQQFHISAQVLEGHLIPKSFPAAANDGTTLKDQWSVQQYASFLIERAELLAEASNELLQGL